MVLSWSLRSSVRALSKLFPLPASSVPGGEALSSQHSQPAPCPSGSYKNAGAGGLATCTTCPVGYTSAAGSTAASDCAFSACPVGYTGDQGSGCNALALPAPRLFAAHGVHACASNATLALKCWGSGFGSYYTNTDYLTPVVAPLVSVGV